MKVAETAAPGTPPWLGGKEDAAGRNHFEETGGPGGKDGSGDGLGGLIRGADFGQASGAAVGIRGAGKEEHRGAGGFPESAEVHSDKWCDCCAG